MNRVERWLWPSVVGGVAIPLGVVCVLLISDNGEVSWKTVAGRGELFLLSGALAAQAIGSFLGPPMHTGLERKRQRGMWFTLLILLVSVTCWSARVADVVNSSKVLDQRPSAALTWLPLALTAVSLALGAYGISSSAFDPISEV